LRATLDAHAADVTATPDALAAALSLPWDEPGPHPPWPGDEWWDRHEPAFAAALAACGVTRRRADRLSPHVRSAYLDRAAWSVRPGAREALDTLSERGWTHLLLANGVPELPTVLADLGLDLSATFVSATTGYEKPHPRAFEQLYDHADGRFWLVGTDPDRDRAGADRAGIPSVLVGDATGDRVVPTTDQVPERFPD
jgi:FMN phosphatase YigB (HAD superfamily)